MSLTKLLVLATSELLVSCMELCDVKPLWYENFRVVEQMIGFFSPSRVQWD